MSTQPTISGPSDPRSMQQLVQDAMTDVRTIADDEKALAQVELKKSAINAGVGAGLVVLFGTLLFFGTFAMVIGIAEAFVAAGLTRWGAYLLTWGIFVFVGILLALLGVFGFLRRVGPPKRAIALGQETVTMVKTRLSTLGRAQPTAHGPASTATVPGPPVAAPAGTASSAATSSGTVRA